MRTKKVAKSYTRQNFASIIDEAANGQVFLISDRGLETVAIVPISVLEKELSLKNVKDKKSFADNAAIGMFKDREDMKDSVTWQNNIRSARLRRNYSE